MADDQNNDGGISQGDIDSLLQEVEQQGGDEQKAAASGGEPPVNLGEWGLSEDEMSGETTARAGGRSGGAAPAPTRRAGGNGNGGGRAPMDAPRDLEFLMDIPLRVSVEVGRSRLSIAELLTLGPGSIVELDKLAGEPLDIFINQKLIARGEAVIINEKFGVRLTDVVSKVERIANLKS